jgi:hypothetical protein
MYKGGPKGSLRKHSSILGKHILGSYVGGVVHFPKILVMGQSNNFFSPPEKK